MDKTALILEGGGMRGVFTAGVLDFFLEQRLIFDNCIGVSAGACHACSYLAGQKGRAFSTATDYLHDRHYCGLYSLLTTGDIFGVKLIYEDIPNRLYPIDNEAFLKNKTVFQSVITNCITGQAEYPRIHDLKKDILYIRASASLPFVSRLVTINGIPYLDGGIADSIPIRQAQKQGARKSVVILTRPAGYRKPPNHHRLLMHLRYANYPNFITAMQNRHNVYNNTLNELNRLERHRQVFIIRPDAALNISRVEKNVQKLQTAYQAGYQKAKERYPALLRYLT